MDDIFGWVLHLHFLKNTYVTTRAQIYSMLKITEVPSHSQCFYRLLSVFDRHLSSSPIHWLGSTAIIIIPLLMLYRIEVHVCTAQQHPVVGPPCTPWGPCAVCSGILCSRVYADVHNWHLCLNKGGWCFLHSC